jgi:hypothetical protein
LEDHKLFEINDIQKIAAWWATRSALRPCSKTRFRFEADTLAPETVEKTKPIWNGRIQNTGYRRQI